MNATAQEIASSAYYQAVDQADVYGGLEAALDSLLDNALEADTLGTADRNDVIGFFMRLVRENNPELGW